MQRFLERQAAQRPQTRGQYEALVSQRSDLQAQLNSLTERRNVLYSQSRRATEAQSPALEARMAEIDARTARLDRQMEELNEQIADAIRRDVPSAQDAQGAREIRIPQITVPPIDFGRGRTRDIERMMVGGLLMEAVVFALIGVMAWRWGMKRMREQFERMFTAQATQLNQLQQAVDVIGVEVERISEGQRYVAKVLNDGSRAGTALPARKEAASPQG